MKTLKPQDQKQLKKLRRSPNGMLKQDTTMYGMPIAFAHVKIEGEERIQKLQQMAAAARISESVMASRLLIAALDPSEEEVFGVFSKVA